MKSICWPSGWPKTYAHRLALQLQFLDGSESMGDHDSDLMIGGASVEDTLTLWASLLREGKERIRPLFTQDRVAISAGQFLDGLLSNEARKTDLQQRRLLSH